MATFRSMQEEQFKMLELVLEKQLTYQMPWYAYPGYIPYDPSMFMN